MESTSGGNYQRINPFASEVARHQLLPFVDGMPSRDNPLGGLPKEVTDMLMTFMDGILLVERTAVMSTRIHMKLQGYIGNLIQNTETVLLSIPLP